MPVLGPLHAWLSEMSSEGSHRSVLFLMSTIMMLLGGRLATRWGLKSLWEHSRHRLGSAQGNPEVCVCLRVRGFHSSAIISYFISRRSSISRGSQGRPPVFQHFSDTRNIPVTPRRGPESIQAWFRTRPNYVPGPHGIRCCVSISFKVPKHRSF